MKVYKNQTKQSAEHLGFGANFAFASDERMSHKGLDITPVRHLDGTTSYEVTEFNGETALIREMSKKEYEKYRTEKVKEL